MKHLDDLIDQAEAETIPDMDRIIRLPRFRALDDVEPLVDHYNKLYFRGDWQIRPVQAAALEEARRARGGFFNIGVGYGKTMISLLLPKVLGVAPYKSVVIVPPRNVDTLVREAQKYVGNVLFDSRVRIMTYWELSNRPKQLENWEPDLIVADEAHNLANLRGATRSIRFIRYVKASGCMFVGMSGTLLNSSVNEFTHLLDAALGEGAPVPHVKHQYWTSCLDPDNSRSFPGWQSWRYMSPISENFGPEQDVPLTDVNPLTYRKEVLREAYRDRLDQTEGIVLTSKSALGNSLIIDPIVDLEVPEEIQDALSKACSVYMLPNGDFIDDQLRLAQAVRQLLCGFYYVWDWPGEPDLEWLEARREWYRELRYVWQRGRPGLDSEGLVRNEIYRLDTIQKRLHEINRYYDEAPPEWRAAISGWDKQFELDVASKIGFDLWAAWTKWKVHRHKPEPPRKAVWISSYLIDDVIERVKGEPPTLIWTSFVELAEEFERRGMPVVDRGSAPPQKPQTCVVSVKSHGTGHNLQEWSRNLIVNPQSNGATMEQLIGRTHRPGQPDPEVLVKIYAHDPEYRKILWKAIDNAKMAKQITGQDQKILIADWTQMI